MMACLDFPTAETVYVYPFDVNVDTSKQITIATPSLVDRIS